MKHLEQFKKYAESVDMCGEYRRMPINSSKEDTFTNKKVSVGPKIQKIQK